MRSPRPFRGLSVIKRLVPLKEVLRGGPLVEHSASGIASQARVSHLCIPISHLSYQTCWPELLSHLSSSPVCLLLFPSLSLPIHFVSRRRYGKPSVGHSPSILTSCWFHPPPSGDTLGSHHQENLPPAHRIVEWYHRRICWSVRRVFGNRNCLVSIIN